MNAGQDITGNGKPNLLLVEHTGGNSFGYVLFEFDNDQVREILRLAGCPSDCADKDGDGIWEYYRYAGVGSSSPDFHLTQTLDKLVDNPTVFERWMPAP